MPSTANYQGIPEKDVKWLKDHNEYGHFEAPKLYKSGDGGIKQRKVFKDKMLFNPLKLKLKLVYLVKRLVFTIKHVFNGVLQYNTI